MKSVITAMGSNRLSEALKLEKFDVLTRDITYKEGILEALMENPHVDILIINEILDGEMEFKELIQNILQINEEVEIIVFVEEKNSEIQNFLFSNGIYQIYENNEININTFINALCKKENKYNLENINREMVKINKKINETNPFYNLEERGKIITVSGSYNSGKSIFTCVLGKEYAKKDKKTLIIDFDIYNQSISTLLNISRNNKEVANVNNQIVRISKNLDALCVMDLLFKDDNQFDYINLEEMLREFKIDYEVILIDTSSFYKYKYLNRILNMSDSIIFLIVPTMLEINKAFSLYEIFTQDLKIDKKKFQIILNKSTKYKIDNNIITNMFGNIVGSALYDAQIEENIRIKKTNNLININNMIGG